MNEIDSSNEL